MVAVRIPTALLSATGGRPSVEVEGGTVRQVLDALAGEHAALRERIFDEGGGVRRFVNVYVGDDDIRFLQGLETPVEAGSTVTILPAVAGGAR